MIDCLSVSCKSVIASSRRRCVPLQKIHIESVLDDVVLFDCNDSTTFETVFSHIGAVLDLFFRWQSTGQIRRVKRERKSRRHVAMRNRVNSCSLKKLVAAAMSKTR